MGFQYQKINYADLNARQQEAYNFQKVSAVLADYGYVTIRVTDDWQGADFIAQHFDGVTFLKVQLKGRLSFDRKYENHDIHVCFCDRDSAQWFVYPHDELLKQILAETNIAETASWETHGGYSFPYLSKRNRELLEPYRLNA